MVALAWADPRPHHGAAESYLRSFPRGVTGSLGSRQGAPLGKLTEATRTAGAPRVA